LVIAWVIRVGDEFVARIHLTALAVSFAGSLVIVSLFDWLARAEFIDRPPFMVVWISMAVFWVVALIWSKNHFERPQ
ncbi:MAG TPA: hypothetical protein VE967_20035, partial [Gemmatimonadaceae bacterium]|nr:hypothetical protein [Gemmatimonadaceae bacterium]